MNVWDDPSSFNCTCYDIYHISWEFFSQFFFLTININIMVIYTDYLFVFTILWLFSEKSFNFNFLWYTCTHVPNFKSHMTKICSLADSCIWGSCLTCKTIHVNMVNVNILGKLRKIVYFFKHILFILSWHSMRNFKIIGEGDQRNNNQIARWTWVTFLIEKGTCVSMYTGFWSWSLTLFRVVSITMVIL